MSLLLSLLGVSVVWAQTWEQTLESVKPAIVSIQVNATRAFDTDNAGFSYATGFIVDAEQGIILTNRHVVQTGPVIAEAILDNNEEITLTPVYRDPVHDFGFFRFDPAQVKFLTLAELPLHPEAARLDTEIRIIGNDAGEKGAILRGTLSRLDRDAPSYGRGNFNDFNTFYIQSASGTSGGSSGSPVLDIQGRVVALNAGSKRSAASSYFLPLDRVVRALDLVQRGEPVTRGTLMTTFQYLPYDELRRRQLRPETEAAARKRSPKATGLLVVEDLVMGGPADGRLQPGDILVAVNGTPTSAFVPLEAVIDDAVGEEITLSIERNGVPMDVTLTVADLHAVTPAAYLEVGGGVLNDLSYQKARTYGVPRYGVSLVETGYALSGLPSESILLEINGQPTPDIRAAEAALAAVPRGERARVRYYHPNNPSLVRVAAVPTSREWFPMRRCDRNDESGLWDCTDSPPAPPPPPPEVQETTFVVPNDRVARKLAASLVMVDFDIPYRVDGVYGSFFRGAGLVVDAERGLIAADRDTVPIMLGEVTLTFAGSVRVPGEVVWLHPEHNLALIHYDPALLGNTPVQSATIDPRPLEPGQKIWQIGVASDEQILSRQTTVERIRPISLPLPATPFFRESNVMLIDPEGVVPSVGGALVDRRGRVHATWASFVDLSGESPQPRMYGMPAEILAEALDAWEKGTDGWASLGVELDRISLADARQRGLGPAQAVVLEAHDPARQVLEITRLRVDAPVAGILEAGDLIVAVNGAPATTFREVEAASRAESLTLEVLRGDQLLTLEVPTVRLSTEGTTHLVGWAGAILQETPPWLSIQRGVPASGVYVAWYWYGTPAARYNLRGTRRITAVNGEAVDSLDAFLARVEGLKDHDAVQLTTVRLDGKQEVLTLRLDLHYWPTFEVRRTDDGWQRIER